MLLSKRAIILSSRFYHRMRCVAGAVGWCGDFTFLECFINKIYTIIFRMTLVNHCDHNTYLNIMQQSRKVLRTYRIQCDLV